MKKTLIFCLALLSQSSAIFCQDSNAWRSKVSPEILAAFNRGEKSDLLVSFSEQADLKGAKTIHGKAAKARFVFDQLQQTAQRSQARAINIARGFDAGTNSLFLVNALSVRQADVNLARQLATLPEVRFISHDPWVFFNSPAVEPSAISVERNAIEWGVQRVRAPEVWALGYTGQGITVGGSDTGYEWVHPALKSHYRGWNTMDSSAAHHYNWHDAIRELNPLNNDSLGNPGINPCGLDSPQPCDDLFHGTHTMGSMTGDDGMGNQIGVAPGAKWVGCRNMERGWGKPSTYIECFQWFLAPTDMGGQNPNPNKAPHVINNSWYCSFEEGCVDLSVNELLHTAVINLKASGVVVVVSNGNAGPNCFTTNGAPAYFEESFSVGSFRINDTISGFSSRGPVIIDNSFRLKPNISAPGHNIRSATLNGEYRNASGTSMAGPHVAGVVALILSARPDLAGEVDLIEDILEQTAIPAFDTIGCDVTPGDAVPNNTYGFGRIDALAALQEALAFSPTTIPFAPAISARLAPNPVRKDAIFHLENLSGKTSMEVFSTDGKLVFSKYWTATGAETLQIPFEKQPSGIYFWQLKSEGRVLSGKLSKV
jgi:serine protease AprX